jgi:hypothetical protein
MEKTADESPEPLSKHHEITMVVACFSRRLSERAFGIQALTVFVDTTGRGWKHPAIARAMAGCSWYGSRV